MALLSRLGLVVGGTIAHQLTHTSGEDRALKTQEPPEGRKIHFMMSGQVEGQSGEPDLQTVMELLEHGIPRSNTDVQPTRVLKNRLWHAPGSGRDRVPNQETPSDHVPRIAHCELGLADLQSQKVITS